MPARIPESTLADVRAAVEAGMTIQQAAKEFNVSESWAGKQTVDLRDYRPRTRLSAACRVNGDPTEEMPKSIKTAADLAGCLVWWRGEGN